MLAEELLYEGGHVAHIALYYERMRMQRIAKQWDKFTRTLTRGRRYA